MDKQQYKVFLQKVLEVFTTNGILFLVGIGTSVLSARILGPTGRGEIGTAVALGGIGSQFLNLGVQTSSKYQLIKDGTLLDRLVGNDLAMGGVAATFSMLLYIFFLLFPSFAPLQGILLALACVYIPLNLYLMLQQNLLIGVDAVRQYNALEILKGLLYPSLVVLLAMAHMARPSTVFTGTLIAATVPACIGLCYLREKANNSIRPSWTVFKAGLPIGIRSYIASLCSYLVIRSDVLMVKYMLGAEQTGFYTVAVSLSDILEMVPQALATILFPAAVAIETDKNRSQFMKRTLLILAGIMGGMTAVVTFLSGTMIRWFYGEVYAPTVTVFKLLMPGIFFMSMQSALSNYFAAKNMWTGNILTPLAGFLLNLAANAFLIPRCGIRGAAMASVMSYFLMFLCMFIRFLSDNKRIKVQEEG